MRSMESSSTHLGGDAEDKERTITELKDRIHVLENELLLKQKDKNFHDVVEHGRAEESLQLMRYIMDQAQDDVSLAGPDGRFYYVNDAKCRSLGYTRDELLSMHIWDVDLGIPKDKWAAAWQYMNEHGFKKFETWQRTKNGQVFQTEVSVTYFDFHGREYLYTFVRDITERKRAEDALRVNEELLRRACCAGRVGLYEWNVDRGTVYFSPEAYELYGLDQGSPVTYETWLETVHSDDREAVERIITEEREKARNISDASIQLEFRALRPDGRVLWIEAKSTYYPEGGDLISRGAMRDITGSRLAEDALKESQTSLARAQAISHTGNWHFDPVTEAGSGSDELFRILGIPRREAFPLSEFIKLVHPDDRPMFQAYFEDMKRTHLQKSGDLRIVRPDGEERDVFLEGELVFDGEGRPRMFGTMQDITERKRTEKALVKEKYILTKSQEAAHVGNWALDVDAGVFTCSDELNRIHNYEPGEVKLTHEWVLSRVHPEDRGVIADFHEVNVREGKRGSIDYRIIRPDGSVRYINAIVDKAVRDKAGKVKRLYGITQDVTERKRAEEDLKVAKQLAELYLDLMGHDINNLHQIALGYLELARDMPAGEGQAEFLDKPVEVLQRSAQLIQNVRKLQKLRDGVFQARYVDVCKVLSDVQRELGSVPNKQIMLNFNGRVNCHVRANELLQEVFANLISNAIKHTGDRAEIIVNLDIVNDKGAGYCRVMVEDDGPGIPDDHKDMLFNRNLKGTNKAKGMGLGLYLVKSLVDSYGGRVWVEDRVPGDSTQGAKFVVMLPAVEK